MIDAILFLIGIIVCVFLIMVIAGMIGIIISAIAAMVGIVQRKANFGTMLFGLTEKYTKEG
ncbi:hypothetical protein [Clostridium sp. AF32-12BH]|uniref:hypothetical protein n=1 Tax=Clostridium sp. AF32-12BH TaxID=2292006 RepID=UPI000E504C35|nr:hypothetical protein [Clostridium sp. AF32-12BH]RHP46937.1 hypothetical protein DWZ40_08510 [Clostridium sp. AF32-12BH]